MACSGGPIEEEKIDIGLSSHSRLTLMGDNLFGAMFQHIQDLIRQADPFRQTALHKMKEALHIHATIKNQASKMKLWVYFRIRFPHIAKLLPYCYYLTLPLTF